MPKKSTFTGITSVPGTYFFDVFGQGFNYRISKSNLFQQMTDEIGASGVQSIDGLSGALQLIAGTNMSIAVNSVDGSFTFNSSLTPENIQSLSFDTAAGVAVTEGQIAWNAVDDTVDIGVPGGAIQVGKEVATTVRNSTGTTLVDGEAVYITGSTGNNTVVSRAQANGPTADLTLGIVTQTIPNGQNGRVTLIGKVRDFDTSAWSEGDELWLSASVAGEITNVKPDPPNHAVHIGFVVRSSATVGIIYVRVLAIESISELHDVVITSVADGDTLAFDGPSQTWVNRNFISGKLFCVSGAFDGAPLAGARLSFGSNEATSDSGIIVPRNCQFVMATLMATGLDGTLTLALEIDQVAQSAAHDLSVTGTVTNESDIVDVASTPLAVSSGQQVNYEVTTAPTTAGAINVVLWFVFD